MHDRGKKKKSTLPTLNHWAMFYGSPHLLCQRRAQGVYVSGQAAL